MEVESSKAKQALSESQARNQHLQEQVAMQRQVLKEMEQQLHSSHQLTAQLRAQVRRPRGVGAPGGAPGGARRGGVSTGQRVSTRGAHGPGFQALLSLLPGRPGPGFVYVCFLICKPMCSQNAPPARAQGHDPESPHTGPSTHVLGKGPGHYCNKCSPLLSWGLWLVPQSWARTPGGCWG